MSFNYRYVIPVSVRVSREKIAQMSFTKKSMPEEYAFNRRYDECMVPLYPLCLIADLLKTTKQLENKEKCSMFVVKN